MKKHVVMLITIVIMVFLLVSPFLFVEKQVDWKTMEKTVSETIDLKEYETLTDQEVKKFYGLTKSMVDQALVYKHKDAMRAEEIAVMKLNDAQDQKMVVDAILARKEKKYNTFKGYGQAQCDLIEDGVLLKNEQYVIFIVEPKATVLKKRIRQLF